MVNKRIPINRICTEFMELGYSHRYGYFLPASMNKMLKNPLYIGYIEKNGKWYEAEHDAIVPREKYDQAQRLFEERKNSQIGKYSFKRGSMLAGLVICKHCGAKYYKSVGHKKLDGTRSEFYVCTTRSKKGSSKEQVIDKRRANAVTKYIAWRNLIESYTRRLQSYHLIQNTLKK